MTYEEFNSKILDYYVQRVTSAFCTLSIDAIEFNKIIPANRISTFDILKYPWSILLIDKNGIPQYFGLIAIQCLAASLMQNDEISSVNAYQIRLCQLLNLDDYSALQSKFRGSHLDEPVQEEIWWSAKRFLNKRYGFNLRIPERSRNAGRYVQYPKSQALLNTEDLLNFTVFFSEEFQVGEILGFDFFKKRLEASLHNIELSRRTNSLLADSLKREQCIIQIYNYYNTWDGQIYKHTFSKKNILSTISVKSENIYRQKLILIMSNTDPQLYYIGNGSKKLCLAEVFNLTDYKYITKHLIIFCQHDYYPDEYEDSRFIDKETDCYIIVNRFYKSSEYRYLENNSIDKININDDLTLYKYRYSNSLTSSPLNIYIPKINPIRLRNGLRLNRSNQYLKGFAPIIICDFPYSIIYMDRKCDYNPETAPEGHYKVRTDYFRDIEFDILVKKVHEIVIRSRNSGWNLKKYTINTDHDIEGWSIVSKATTKEINPTRFWMLLNMNKKKSKLSLEANTLFKAINNSKK